MNVNRITKWRRMFVALLFCILIGCLSFPVFAEEDTGEAVQVATQSSTAASPTLPYDASLKAYTVSSVADLNTLRQDLQNGEDYSGLRVLQTQDIDIAQSSVALTPYTYRSASKTYSFNGLFNGQGHTIAHYTDSRSGLFDAIGAKGQVGNLKMTVDLSISATLNLNSEYKGIIADTNEGQITRCATSGTVAIKDKTTALSISGICGRGSNVDVGIANCCSTVDFSNDVGAKGASFYGITAWYAGNNCYYAGKLPLVYKAVQPISAYFIGNAQDTCFYNIQTLGVTLSKAYGVSLTTSKMKTQELFSKAGWDFDSCWTMGTNAPELNFDKDVTLKLIQQIDVSVKLGTKTYDATKSTTENRETMVESVTPIISDNPYHLKCEYAVKAGTTPIYNGTMGENARGFVHFDHLNLVYDSNDEVVYVLTPTVASELKNGTSVIGYGGYLENGVKLTSEEKTQLLEKAKEACTINIEQVLRNQFGKTQLTKSDVGSYVGNSWLVFTAARCNYPQPYAGFYDDCFQAYCDEYAAGRGSTAKSQDISKDIMAITAMGYDARNVGGHNLLELNTGAGKAGYLVGETMQLAFSTQDYEIPSVWDEKAFIHACAVPSDTDLEGKALTGDVASDFYTMHVQPIMTYYDPNAKEGDEFYDVKVATEKAINIVSGAQADTGSCWGGFTDDLNNPWTNAQVQIMVGLIPNFNPLNDSYIKNGHSIIDGTLSYFDFDKKTMSSMIQYEPQQIARGLNAFIRGAEGRNNIFDCKDVADNMVDYNNTLKALPEMASLQATDKDAVVAAWTRYQAMTDAQKTNIISSNLTKLTADYYYFTADDQLTSAISNAEVESAKTTIYQSASITMVLAEIKTAKTFIGSTDKTAIVAEVSKLNDAVKKMVTVETDDIKTVETAIDAIGTITSLQDKSRVDAAQTKYDGLKYDESKARVSNKEVLETAQKNINGLTSTGNLLTTTISQLKEKLNDTAIYTNSSLKKANETITKAEAIDTNSATLSVMNNMLTDLSNIYWEAIGDKTSLNARIADIETALKNLKEADYTQASWSALNEKLEAAKTVSASNDVNQDAVKTATDNLDIAYAGLALNRLTGDINNDGTVDEIDASLALRNSAKLYDLDENQQKAADVNGDNSVDEIDASLILRYAAGLIGGFNN